MFNKQTRFKNTNTSLYLDIMYFNGVVTDNQTE